MVQPARVRGIGLNRRRQQTGAPDVFILSMTMLLRRDYEDKS